MSNVPEIRELDMVITPYLNGGQLISYTSKYLTKPGDNYGSIMVAIVAKVQHAEGQVKDLSVIAKLPPITNDMYWTIFNPEHTCLIENAVYSYLAPALRQLQVEVGLSKDNQLFDCFARYYGSRISLNSKVNIVDRDAILLQENLLGSGFVIGNRNKMYDYEHSMLTLNYLAKFHALTLALRIKKPEEFDMHFKPLLKKFNVNNNLDSEAMANFQQQTITEVELATNNDKKIVDQIRKLYGEYHKFNKSPHTVETPFTTIVHCDLWINNIMMKYNDKGSPCELKIVDYQLTQLDSLSHDVSFFLFSSVDADVLEEHYDNFLLYYYNVFIDCLKSVGVSTSEYSYEGFRAEIKRTMPIELIHAVYMIKVILADNSTLPEDFKDMSMDVFNKNTGVEVITKRTAQVLRLADKFNLLF